MEKFYTYILTDPRDSQPFYVGKGCGTRMYYHKKAALGNYKDSYKPHHDRIREIIAMGYDIIYDKVLINVDETAALNKERELIEAIGRACTNDGPLLNLTMGGQQGGASEKPVSQYTIAGKLISHFPSAKVASEQTPANRSYITQCCKGKRKSAGGYLWGYRGCRIPKYSHGKFKQVRQYSVDKKHIADYRSLTEAQNATDIERHNISECCRGKSKTAGGFIWEYC